MTALDAAGIARRRPGWTDGTPPAPITAEQLTELYVENGKTIGEVAAADADCPEYEEEDEGQPDVGGQGESGARSVAHGKGCNPIATLAFLSCDQHCQVHKAHGPRR